MSSGVLEEQPIWPDKWLVTQLETHKGWIFHHIFIASIISSAKTTFDDPNTLNFLAFLLIRPIDNLKCTYKCKFDHKISKTCETVYMTVSG